MKKEKCGIYSITNTLDGKKYIGKSKAIYKRWSRHKIDLNNGKGINRYLQNAWNKYGGQVFKFEILEECPPKVLEKREFEYINLYRSSENTFGYNIVDNVSGFERYKDTSKNKIEKVYKKIYKVNKITNEVIRIYDSYNDFCIDYNLSPKKSRDLLFNKTIGKNSKRLTYKGFFFILEDIYNPEMNYPDLLKRGGWAKPKQPKIYKTPEERNVKRVPISLQNIETQEVRNFKSLLEAEKELGFKIRCLINGYKNKGGGKFVKITQWRGWQIYK